MNGDRPPASPAWVYGRLYRTGAELDVTGLRLRGANSHFHGGIPHGGVSSTTPWDHP